MGTKNLIALIGAIWVVLLIMVGIGSNAIVNTYGQTLGKLFFEEKGKITGQKSLGANRTEISYSSNGTMKGDIEVTTSGNFVSVSRGDNVSYSRGQAIVTTKDGTEKANYTFLAIGRVADDDKPIFMGASVYSTNSTDKLAFLNNQVGVFRVELDKQGNFVNKEWEWK
jgi:hypothetical protein